MIAPPSQTGSGKTHTMEGAGEDGGMIPRAVHQVFNTAMGLKERGWEVHTKGVISLMDELII